MKNARASRESNAKPANPYESKGPGATVILLVLGGVALLGLCCVSSAVGGYFIFFFNRHDPEEVIVGSWKSERWMGGFDVMPTFDFHADGTFHSKFGGGIHKNGTWRTFRKDGNKITVEVSFLFGNKQERIDPNRPAMRMNEHFEIRGRDEIVYLGAFDAGGGIRYTRK